jgi:hypothetical protein
MRTSLQAALWDEQRVGVDQMAEVFAVAAVRFGSTEAEEGLRRLSRYFTWGAFGVLSPVVMARTPSRRTCRRSGLRRQGRFFRSK